MDRRETLYLGKDVSRQAVMETKSGRASADVSMEVF